MKKGLLLVVVMLATIAVKADLDEELVYNLTAVLFCNQNFCRKHPLYKKSENDVTTLVSICLSVLFTVRFQLV